MTMQTQQRHCHSGKPNLKGAISQDIFAMQVPRDEENL
jgi:hypothetical protein